MIFTNKEIILPQTLALLEQLQSDDFLQDFFLVGGTSLALQIGHRLSIDLDLFSQKEFDTQDLENHLVKNYSFFTDFVAKNTLKGSTNQIKTDFITHTAPLVEPLIHHKTLRLASIIDIGAMKLNAIAHSGNRQKDFYDMFYLLEHHALIKYLGAYEKKYPNSNLTIPLKGLTYFEDIDFNIEKPMLVKKITFKQVKDRLITATKYSDKVF